MSNHQKNSTKNSELDARLVSSPRLIASPNTRAQLACCLTGFVSTMPKLGRGQEVRLPLACLTIANPYSLDMKGQGLCFSVSCVQIIICGSDPICVSLSSVSLECDSSGEDQDRTTENSIQWWSTTWHQLPRGSGCKASKRAASEAYMSPIQGIQHAAGSPAVKWQEWDGPNACSCQQIFPLSVLDMRHPQSEGHCHCHCHE
jgi:hypothetical protein